MIIDLHGLTESEAIPRIDAILWELEEDQWDEIEIITGKGEVLRSLVIDEVEKKGFSWKFNNGNEGSIIVY